MDSSPSRCCSDIAASSCSKVRGAGFNSARIASNNGVEVLALGADDIKPRFGVMLVIPLYLYVHVDAASPRIAINGAS